ncbi:unnamed protein product, partial [Prorocentrum cordatum]
ILTMRVDCMGWRTGKVNDGLPAAAAGAVATRAAAGERGALGQVAPRKVWPGVRGGHRAPPLGARGRRRLAFRSATRRWCPRVSPSGQHRPGPGGAQPVRHAGGGRVLYAELADQRLHHARGRR